MSRPKENLSVVKAFLHKHNITAQITHEDNRTSIQGMGLKDVICGEHGSIPDLPGYSLYRYIKKDKNPKNVPQENGQSPCPICAREAGFFVSVDPYVRHVLGDRLKSSHPPGSIKDKKKITFDCPGCNQPKTIAVAAKRLELHCRQCKDGTPPTKTPEYIRGKAAERNGTANIENRNYSATEYVEWSCDNPTHPPWKAVIVSVERGSWCKQCGKKPIGETILNAILRYYFGNSVKAQYNPFKELHLQTFDNFLTIESEAESFQIAADYHGVQHYKLNAKFHETIHDLYDQQERDKQKLTACKAHQTEYLIVPYWEDEAKKFHERISIIHSSISSQMDDHPISIPELASDDILAIADIAQRNITINQERKDSFIALCSQKGIRILEDYINETTPIQLDCDHRPPRSRRPMDVRAAKGSHCCEVSANGTFTSLEKVIAVTALSGIFFDPDPNQPLDKSIPRAARDQFHARCLCGTHKTAHANLNGLQNKLRQIKTILHCDCALDLTESEIEKYYLDLGLQDAYQQSLDIRLKFNPHPRITMFQKFQSA